MDVPRLKLLTPATWLDIGLNAGGDSGELFESGHGASSFVVGIGELVAARQRESIAGAAGLLDMNHGERGREIVWSGMLRLSEYGVQRVYNQRDLFMTADAELVFYSPFAGATYSNCVMEEFPIDAPTRIQADGKIRWIARYRIKLMQLLDVGT